MLGAKIYKTYGKQKCHCIVPDSLDGKTRIYCEYPQYLLGEKQGYLLDMPGAKAGEILDRYVTKTANVTIFEVAKDAWKRGLIDEASFVISMACLRSKEVFGDLIGQELILVANDEIEFEMMKIMARAALLLTSSRVPDESDYDEFSLHAYIWALSGRFKIHVFSSTQAHGKHEFANTFLAEDFHPTSTLAPIGIIPNAQIWCYVASTLTIALSIEKVACAIKHAYQSADPTTASFLEILLFFYGHLRTNQFDEHTLVQHMKALFSRAAFSEFNVDAPNDSYYFLDVLSNELSKCGVTDLSQKRVEIDSLEFIRIVPCEKRKPQHIIMPCRVVERIGRDREPPWSGTLEDIPLRELNKSPDCIYGALVYRSRKSDNEYTFDQYITKKLDGSRPYVLIIKHSIGNKESPARFIVPCVIYVDNCMYTLHGASMHDAVRSDGHYVTLIASNATMFCYDSQFGDHDIDMRSFRVRYLCYLLHSIE